MIKHTDLSCDYANIANVIFKSMAICSIYNLILSKAGSTNAPVTYSLIKIDHLGYS